MKTFRQLFSLLVLTTLVFPAFAKGTVKTQNRGLSGFNSIKVSSGIDLYLKMGDAESVTITADEDIIDKIVAKVENGVLKIYVENHFGWKWNYEQKAYVTVKQLAGINASAGSDVESENTLVADNLEIDASSGSDIEIHVKAGTLKLETSSGSDAKLTGTAEKFEADASSGSDISASGLETKICRVSVSSGSDASVNVSEELYANASSGGDVKYSGNPKKKDIHESSGGDVYGQ